MSKIQQRKRVSIYDLGLLMRVIHMDYSPKNDEELAELISMHFDVMCLEEDIKHYRQMHVEYEDYEKLSRMAENGNVEYIIE
jgi:hypothetical protein